MVQQQQKDSAGGAKRPYKGTSARDKLLRQVEKQQKRKLEQVREAEHQRQLDEWYRDAISIHGGDCQD